MTSTNDESVLAEASAVLTREFVNVYVKTRPIRQEGGRIGVTLTASGNNQAKNWRYVRYSVSKTDSSS